MTDFKRPTIKDVAAQAGVSKATVSLVLQNSKLVRPETRTAVLAAMKALSYVRNRAAVTLRQARTGLVGLVINDLRNPFFTEFAASVQMALHEHDYATVIANCDEDPRLQDRTVRSMLEHDVAALLISPCYGNVAAAFEAIRTSGRPALQVLRRVEDGAPALPFFSHDYLDGGRQAIRHFLDEGLTRIAFVGGIEGRDITRDRMGAYLDRMEALGLAATVLPGRPTRRFGREIAATLVHEHPQVNAAICFNDLVALGLMAGLTELGRRIGEDFFVAGFDDVEEARLSYPPLTTVRCDVARFGRICAEVLRAQIEDGEPPPDHRLLPVELVVRASSRVTAR